MCTRVFWNTNDVAMVTGRTLDWETSDEPQLWVTPRGTVRTDDAGEGAAIWTAKHGSVALSGWGCVTSEAINEHGFAAHTLYLGEARWEAADDRPAISNLLWTQYAVDNFRTVAEAVEGLAQVRVVSLPMHGQHLGAHLAIEDPSGDTAIIEMVDGRAVVHHGARFNVMTNDPTYDEQVANLDRYEAFGGELGLPGDIVSEDRFVRATYFLSHLPAPANADEVVAGAFNVVRNISVPFGAPDSRFDTYPTWWATSCDLTNRVLYFSSTLAPNVVWLSLDALDFAAGSGTRALDPRDPALAGELADHLRAAPLNYGVPAPAGTSSA